MLLVSPVTPCGRSKCGGVVCRQEHTAYLEKDDVGLGLTEDSIKAFNVGEAVWERGLTNSTILSVISV